MFGKTPEEDVVRWQTKRERGQPNSWSLDANKSFLAICLFFMRLHCTLPHSKFLFLYFRFPLNGYCKVTTMQVNIRG